MPHNVRFLLIIVVFTIHLFIQTKAETNKKNNFKLCCTSGISFLEKSSPFRVMTTDDCTVIGQTVTFFNQANISLTEGQCNLVKHGCYLAGRTNCVCKYGKDMVESSQELQKFEFDAYLFDTAQKCCLKHKLLPTANETNNDNECCLPNDYEEDLDYGFIQFIDEDSTVNPVQSTTLESTTTMSPAATSKPSVTQMVNSNIEMSIMQNETSTWKRGLELTLSTPEIALFNESNLKLTNISAPAGMPKPMMDIKTAPMINEISIITDISTISPMHQKEPTNSESSDIEVVCEDGYIWYPEKRLCLHKRARCPRGMYLSVKQNICLPRNRQNTNCPSGFEYKDDVNECTDVNECMEGLFVNNIYVDPCPVNGIECRNTNGSYECICKKGFQRIRESECVDIDECQAPVNVCKRGFKCTNVIGSYQCNRLVPCGFGYILNPESQDCEDIDECAIQPDICGPFMICINVRGAHKCVPEKCPGKQRRNSKGLCTPCPSGYIYNDQRSSCDDVDECLGNITLCRPFEKCVNRPGDFICEPKIRCDYGFQLNANGSSCEDINECEAGNFNCQFYKICVNTKGSYYCETTPCHPSEIYDYQQNTCVCPPGYRHKEQECIDVDECMEEEANENKSSTPLCLAGRTCVNTPGSFRCVTLTDCPKGFQRKSIRDSCTDIDECATGTARCGLNMHCENTIGTYRCFCERGFRSINETSCEDIDECEVFRPSESCPDKRSRCVNTAGSYKCICPSGFVWHGYPVNVCRDVNECVLGIDSCGMNHQCANDEGGYHCICSLGYQLSSDNKSCIDINECLETMPKAPCATGICVNTVGGFRCDCPVGYRLDSENQCVDIDECMEKDDICLPRHSRGISSGCVNLHGGYRCVTESCPAMYTKSKVLNGYRCTLQPQFDCIASDLLCLHGRPVRMEHLHIELTAPIQPILVLGEVDSSVVTKGAVHVELLEHFAHQMLTNTQISVKTALKLRLKPNNNRYIQVLLTKSIEAPADILVSVRLSAIRGRMQQIRSITKFNIYTTEMIGREVSKSPAGSNNNNIRSYRWRG